MRALVIGASGQVGAALVAWIEGRSHSVVGTHSRVAQPGTRPLDLTDAAATASLVEESGADWVFCSGGLTYVDYCEDHPDEAFGVNRDAVAHAARVAAKRGAGFVYYSTEYVFDGQAGPYAEDDPARPLSVYGESKLAGERAALEENPRTIVIRTTVVYGPEPQGKNFVYQLLRRLRAGERMRVPVDQVSSPTYNVDVAAASVQLAERGLSGIFNVAGTGVLGRHAFAQIACDVFGLDASLIDPVSTADLHQRARRPLSAGLRSDRIRATLGYVPRGPRDGLLAMREALARPS
jgi:dTDP-4-dehydrorhamnose reductase